MALPSKSSSAISSVERRRSSGVDAALGDAEAELSVGARSVALALGPQRRAPHRVLELAAGDAGRRHLVEAHRDVAAEVRLDRGCELGREARGRAVVDASERHALVVDARDRVAEREDLEAAGVGEDRQVPRHEAVQPAELADQLVAGPEMQVVGVAEQDLGAEVAHLVRVQRLHGPLRADRHEDGRAHLPVRGPQHPGAGSPVGRLYLEDRPHRATPSGQTKGQETETFSPQARLQATFFSGPWPREPRPLVRPR